MVNSTLGYRTISARVSRNGREVHYFSSTERAPAVPLAAQTSVQQEIGEAKESHAEPFAPASAGNKIEGHVVTFVVQESHNPMGITPRETLLVNEIRECVQSATTGLVPLATNIATAPQKELPVSENASNGLDPNSAGDKLEGYIPRYFLKEDGKDDNSG